jgi:hypothetical protein
MNEADIEEVRVAQTLLSVLVPEGPRAATGCNRRLG